MKTKALVILFLLSLLSCSKPIDQNKYLKENLRIKVEEYLTEKEIECKEKAASEAVVYVDSLISKWINLDLLDSLEFPNRPVKPITPEHIIDQWQDPKEKSLFDTLK